MPQKRTVNAALMPQAGRSSAMKVKQCQNCVVIVFD
jgi:hypothetical protein